MGRSLFSADSIANHHDHGVATPNFVDPCKHWAHTYGVRVFLIRKSTSHIGYRKTHARRDFVHMPNGKGAKEQAEEKKVPEGQR